MRSWPQSSDLPHFGGITYTFHGTFSIRSSVSIKSIYSALDEKITTSIIFRDRKKKHAIWIQEYFHIEKKKLNLISFLSVVITRSDSAVQTEPHKIPLPRKAIEMTNTSKPLTKINSNSSAVAFSRFYAKSSVWPSGTMAWTPHTGTPAPHYSWLRENLYPASAPSTADQLSPSCPIAAGGLTTSQGLCLLGCEGKDGTAERPKQRSFSSGIERTGLTWTTYGRGDSMHSGLHERSGDDPLWQRM